MPVEVANATVVCCKCGKAYGRKKGNFLTSYGALYKGSGYLPYCITCTDEMYTAYTKAGASPKDAVRQVCRKLDLYWNSRLFETAEKQSAPRSLMSMYIGKINAVKYASKSYDDTLREEESLWAWSEDKALNPDYIELKTKDDSGADELDQELVLFWGSGYSAATYEELDAKYAQWTADLGELDPAEQAIYKQICILEYTINKDSAAGKSIDKHVNALNTLLGSANLKPAQKKAEDSDVEFDNTPLGVWIKRWENSRPIPEPDPELQDVDNIVRYIEIWFKGHLSKMVGLKNSYSKMYEDEISKFRVERPEFEDEDDEAVFVDIFSKPGDEE